MPYVLSPFIDLDSPGMWFEGRAYEKKSIYSISQNKLPPVNYDEHLLRPHSLTHIETPAHTQNNGKRLEYYYNFELKKFFGTTLVIKLPGNNYESIGNGIYHWLISQIELQNSLQKYESIGIPPKILITTDFYPQNLNGYHDPNFVLTLSSEAAEYLISVPGFELYGTSWKSSDYNPGKMERPIHNTLFRNGLILENLHLKEVPEGIYFMSAFPLPLVDASESPVVPVLFTKEELLNSF